MTAPAKTIPATGFLSVGKRLRKFGLNKTTTAVQPKPPGRPPLPPGEGKEVRASLRTTPERLAKADRLSEAAGLSRNAWLERLIDAAEK